MATTTMETVVKEFEATVNTEPLKSAYELERLEFRSVEQPRAFPEPKQALQIEASSRFDRLAAAHHADVFLFQCTQQFKKRPEHPALSDRLAGALGVWAMTRVRIGLDDDALAAMGRVMEWIEHCPESSTSAHAYQRSARLNAEIAQQLGPTVAALVSMDIGSEIRTAIVEHSLLAGGDVFVGSAHLDYGRMLLSNGYPKRGRTFLRAALRRLLDPDLLFEARCLIVSSHLHEDDLENARKAALSIDATALEPRQSYVRLRMQSRLHQKDQPEVALGHRLDAAAVAAENYGPECLLDDLVKAGELRDRCEIDTETEERLVEFSRALAPVVDSGSWKHHVQSFGQRLILGDPLAKDCTLPGLLHKQLRVWQQAELKSQINRVGHSDPGSCLDDETEEIVPVRLTEGC